MEAQKRQVEGHAPSLDDLFYVQWGRETVKNNINLLNQILRQLVTLDTALLAATIGFIDQIKTPEWAKVLTFVCLFVSLVIAFLGVLPYRGEVDLRRPEQIRAHKEKALCHKRCFLTVGALFLLLTFLLSMIGLIAV